MSKETPNGSNLGSEKPMVVSQVELGIRQRIGMIMFMQGMGSFDAYPYHQPGIDQEPVEQGRLRIVQKGVDHKNYATFEQLTKAMRNHYWALITHDGFDRKQASAATVKAIDAVVEIEKSSTVL